MSIDLFGLFDILLQKIRYQCFDDVFHCDKSSILHIFLEQLTEISRTFIVFIGITILRIYCIDRYIVWLKDNSALNLQHQTTNNRHGR